MPPRLSSLSPFLVLVSDELNEGGQPCPSSRSTDLKAGKAVPFRRPTEVQITNDKEQAFHESPSLQPLSDQENALFCFIKILDDVIFQVFCSFFNRVMRWFN